MSYWPTLTGHPTHKNHVYIFSSSSRSGNGVIRVEFRRIDDTSFLQQTKISPADFNSSLLWLSVINVVTSKKCTTALLSNI